MASGLGEVLSAGRVGAVAIACGPDPAEDAEKERETQAGPWRLGFPFPGPRVGPGTVHVTYGSGKGELSLTFEAKPEPSHTSPGFRENVRPHISFIV